MNHVLVTSLIDLGAREDREKGADLYFGLGMKLLQVLEDEHVFAFVEPYLVRPFEKLGLPKLTVLPHRLEETPTFQKLPTIQAARQARPFHVRNERKDTPLYAVFQRTKLHLWRQVAETFPHASSITWLDLGIGQTIPIHEPGYSVREALTALRRRVTEGLVLAGYHGFQKVDDFQAIRQILAGGLLMGRPSAVKTLVDRVDQRAEELLRSGFAPHDETLIEDVVARFHLPHYRHEVPYATELFGRKGLPS